MKDWFWLLRGSGLIRFTRPHGKPANSPPHPHPHPTVTDVCSSVGGAVHPSLLQASNISSATHHVPLPLLLDTVMAGMAQVTIETELMETACQDCPPPPGPAWLLWAGGDVRRPHVCARTLAAPVCV